jgi:hypothetical protein
LHVSFNPRNASLKRAGFFMVVVLWRRFGWWQ